MHASLAYCSLMAELILVLDDNSGTAFYLPFRLKGKEFAGDEIQHFFLGEKN